MQKKFLLTTLKKITSTVLAVTLTATAVLVAVLLPKPLPAGAAVANSCSTGTGTVMVDASNAPVHVVTFSTAATCTYVLPNDVTSIDYLVVGGGGGGGGGDASPAKGGQGGRGGVVSAATSATVSAGATLTVTVGSGGAGGAAGANGTSGGSSSLSGGGVSVTAAGGNLGLMGTNSENSGGSGTGNGGAGQNPGAGGNSAGGGNGSSNAITGSSTTYGGGGGGGSTDSTVSGASGGTGGGGAGGKPDATAGTAGTAGLGGGGGGGGGDNSNPNRTSGGAGGRGVVVIKFSADVTAPAVSTYSPADNSTSISSGTDLVLTFSESVTAQAGKNITIYNTSDSTTFATIAANDTTCAGTDCVTVSGSTVTINPGTNLSKSKSYAVQIDSGAFKDSAGNSYAGIGDNTTWNFTTSSAGAVTSISISSTGGSDNTLIVDEILEVTVVFDLDITVTGLPYVPVVLTNATRNASYHSGSGGTTLVFRYQIASGDIDADGASIVTNTLNNGGGTLTNSGVNADLSHSAVAAVDGVDEVEGVAPTATLVPVDNATGVSITANLVLTFSESVTAQSSGANRSIEIFRSDGTSIETIAADNAKVTVSGSTVTINPAATLLNSTGYYVQVGSNSFKDAAGNAYDGIGDSSSWNFTTAATDATTTTTAATTTTTTAATTTTTVVRAAVARSTTTTTSTTTTSTTTTLAPRRITICHATGSRSNPYVAITVDLNGLNGHGDHPGDIIPAPAAGCSRAAVAAATTTTTLSPTTTVTRGRPGAANSTPAPTTTLPARQQITICHATKSSTNPYVEITVDLDGLNGHGDHGDDIIPAPAGGCDSRAVKDAAREAEVVAKKIEAKEKITICHATGSESNPYVEITIDTDGLAGHADHEGDIIPAPAGGCGGQAVKKAAEIREQKNNGRITICHATGSATNPFVEITVDMSGLNGHGDHADDIIPAPPSGCPKQITPDVREKMVRANERITICHATGSATNPYVEITIDTDGLAGHGDHSDDIIPAPAEGCGKQAITRELENRKKPDGKITICHATRSATNPYVEITVDIDGLSGHGDHLDDIIPAPLGGCGIREVEKRLTELGINEPETIDICHATKDPNRPYIKETVDFDTLDGHGQHNGDIIPAPAAGCSCGAIDEALRGKSAPAGSLLATQSQVNAERNGDAATDLYELVEPQGKKSGSRSATVSLTPEDSAPSMQLLSATVEGGGATAKITSSGVDYNKPSVWQAEGFGAYCWKLEPFGDNDYRYLLPEPSAPPDGRFAGLPYSAVIVKAGSIQESDPEYQVNTTFMNPAGGTEVFADVNRNGVSDPGGQGGGLLGDKSISHIILCVGESEYSAVAMTTTTTTIAPTETVPDQSTTTTTLPTREMVNACPKVSDEEPTSSTTTTTTTIRPTTTSTTVRSSTTTTTSSTSTTSTTVRSSSTTTARATTTTTSTTVRPTTTTVGSLATSTTARATTTSTTVRPTTTSTTIRPTTTSTTARATTTSTTVRPTSTTTSTTVRATTTTVGSFATSTTARPTTTSTTARPTTTSTTVRPTSTTTSTTVRLTTTTVAATTSTLAPGATTTTLPSGETTTTSTIAPDDDSPQPLTFEIVAPRGAPLPKDATITLVVSTGSDVETMVLTIDLVEFTPDFRYSSAQTTEAAPRADSLESLPETGGPRWTTEQRLGWLLGVFGMFLASVSMSARRRRRRRGA